MLPRPVLVSSARVARTTQRSPALGAKARAPLNSANPASNAIRRQSRLGARADLASRRWDICAVSQLPGQMLMAYASKTGTASCRTHDLPGHGEPRLLGCEQRCADA